MSEQFVRVPPSGNMVPVMIPVPPPEPTAHFISFSNFSYTFYNTPGVEFELDQVPNGRGPYVMPADAELSAVRLMWSSSGGEPGCTQSVIFRANGVEILRLNLSTVGDVWSLASVPVPAGSELRVYSESVDNNPAFEGIFLVNWSIKFEG